MVDMGPGGPPGGNIEGMYEIPSATPAQPLPDIPSPPEAKPENGEGVYEIIPGEK